MEKTDEPHLIWTSDMDIYSHDDYHKDLDLQGEVLVCGGLIEEPTDGEGRDSSCYVLDQQVLVISIRSK